MSSALAQTMLAMLFSHLLFLQSEPPVQHQQSKVFGNKFQCCTNSQNLHSYVVHFTYHSTTYQSASQHQQQHYKCRASLFIIARVPRPKSQKSQLISQSRANNVWIYNKNLTLFNLGFLLIRYQFNVLTFAVVWQQFVGLLTIACWFNLGQINYQEGPIG